MTAAETANLLAVLCSARQNRDRATAQQILQAIAPVDRAELLRSLPPSLQTWLRSLPVLWTTCDLTPEQERDDLNDIVQAAYLQDERDDVLQLLRGIVWCHPEAKADFWRSLPSEVQTWLSSVPPPAPVLDRPGLDLENSWGLTPMTRAIARGVVLAAEGLTDAELEQKLRAAGIACPLEWIQMFSTWLKETA